MSERVRELLYEASELPEGERVDVARHLAQCSACALEYCRLQADLEGIAEAHVEAPRPQVFEQLRREVARHTQPLWWSRSWQALRRPVPMYGAVLAGLVPAVLWLASLAQLSPDDTPIDGTTRVPTQTLTDYDATEPSPAHRDVL